VYVISNINRSEWKKSTGLSCGLIAISWDADKFHFHQLNDFEKSFQTEEEALAFGGFIAARNWMEEHEFRLNHDIGSLL
jgi:hypothetical protein